MPEKIDRWACAAFCAAIMLSAFWLMAGSIREVEAVSDKWGIQKLYPTKSGGNEWYVDMNDPKSDSYFKNWKNVAFSKKSDGSWQVSADQIRLEAWSKSNQKWKNVEITAYFKVTSGNGLFQMYSRGGHHTSNDPCLGTAYKARIYPDGHTTWVKEVGHPAYTGNRGSVDVAPNTMYKWIGFKAVIYNYVENGKTYVMLRSYVDPNPNDSSGNLKVTNNWKVASVVKDTGGWSTSDSDFTSSCGYSRSQILSSPGGTLSQNIAAFRTDDATWRFKYLSVREIVPP